MILIFLVTLYMERGTFLTPSKTSIARPIQRIARYIRAIFKCTPAPMLPSGEPLQGVVLHRTQFFPVFYRVSMPIYANVC